MRKLFVLLTTVVVVLAFTLPAMAQAQWSFYGSARMWTSYESTDDQTPQILSGTGAPGNYVPFYGSGSTAGSWNAGGTVPNQDDSDVPWILQSNSRIGASVAWGNIGGRFEYGSTPSLRLLFGTWNFGPGTLLIGQDYTPFMYLISGMCGPGGGECNGIAYGSIYGGRLPQLKLIMGGFNVALLQPYLAPSYTISDASVTGFMTRSALGGYPVDATATPFIRNTAVDADNLLPKLEASYSFNLGPVGLWVGGLYNYYKLEFVNGTNIVTQNIKSYALAAGGRAAFGPFYIGATLQWAQNPNSGYTGFATIIPATFLYDVTTNTSSNANYWAAQLIPGFKINDMLSLEGGIIWQTADVDDPFGAGVTLKEDQMIYYLQAVISPAKNVAIVPELGMIDYKSLKAENTGLADRDLGSLTYFGVKWQINF